ncbi:SAV_915 family protein [Streptomyces sp. NPDC051940]|uniref:SAV_915 family protein n=1 Tax=Streptomyces sp. NPDC051940 TaxID=3155675 RepID=UPI0034362871
MAQQLLFVPVSNGSDGYALRMFRTPLGTRTAVAFTSEQALVRVLGPAQPWIRLAESAVRSLAAPLGARRLTVDPLLTARQPRPVDDTADAMALAVAVSC